MMKNETKQESKLAASARIGFWMVVAIGIFILERNK